MKTLPRFNAIKGLPKKAPSYVATVVFGGSAAAAAQAYKDIVLNTRNGNLVLYYPLDEDFNTVTMHPYFGGTQITEFWDNGLSDVNLEQGTVSCWFYYANNLNDGLVTNMWQIFANSNNRMELYKSGLNLIFYSRLNSQTKQLPFGLVGDATSMLPKRTWINYTQSWNTSGQLIGYVNGAQADAIDMASGWGAAIADWSVGQQANTTQKITKGSIGHVAWWDQQLSASEISSIFSGMSTQEATVAAIRPSQIVGYWPMDSRDDGERSFRVVAGRSGNASPGSVTTVGNYVPGQVPLYYITVDNYQGDANLDGEAVGNFAGGSDFDAATGLAGTSGFSMIDTRTATGSFVGGGVNIPDPVSAVLPTGSGTVALWVHMDKAWNLTGACNILEIMDATTPQNRIYFSKSNAGSISVFFEGQNTAKAMNYKPPGADPNDWIHLAGTWNANTGSTYLYYNGSLVQSTNGLPAMQWPTYAKEISGIGTSPSNVAGATETPPGGVAHVAIWNTDLAASEISALWNSGS